MLGRGVGVEENDVIESNVQHSVYLELFTRMHENDSTHLTSSNEKKTMRNLNIKEY